MTSIRSLLLAVAMLIVPVAPVQAADFGLASVGGSATDPTGARLAQAGAHPDLTTQIRFKTTGTNADQNVALAGGQVKDVTVDLPPGLVANPTVAPTCSAATYARFVSSAGGTEGCPSESQVGVVRLGFFISFVNGGAIDLNSDDPSSPFGQALYNITPPPGVVARFAFQFLQTVTFIDASVINQDGTYVVRASVVGASQSKSLVGTAVTIWGVPADSVHDPQRSTSDGQAFGAASSSPRRPFVTAPTECSGRSLVTHVSATSWLDPTNVQRASFDTDFNGFPLRAEGCGALSFTPSIKIEPSTTLPDTPAGLDVDLTSPQNIDNPDGLASAQLKDVQVTLPEGMTLNPGSADGLEACSDAQLGLGNDNATACPAASKLGTVTATSPLLDEPLTGEVYLRSQNSQDPESGEMFRLALVLRSEQRGILIKLAGSAAANKSTGQLTTTFKNNPQVPVEKVTLHLKSGPRAPLATPASCGAKTTEIELTSWAAHDIHTQDAFSVPCINGLGAFNPALSAGTSNPAGGAFSPFGLSITKPDGNAAIDGLTVSLPPGLLAKLKGNIGTQVGTVTAFAGPGSNPFALPGKVFLEGAYGDAPFSLRVEVPAKAGPFDLGTVTVRQKIYVDPIDAHVTVVSDPVPTIVSGVPVRLQRLDVNIDKAGFIINPTSCAPKTIGGNLHSAAGTTAALSVRFQVGGCAALALKPTLGLTLSGKGQTTDGKHPAVSAVVSQPTGQANLKKVRVALPLSLALDPDNAASDDLCSFVEGSKPDPKCPASSVVGRATAVTPILDEPLTGPVYFVKNERKDPKSGRSIKTTPKLVIPLTGQNGVKLTLTGASTVVDDQLVTTFDNIPDAPVSSFKMDITGGKKGILVVSNADICKATQIADQQINGQNTKTANADVYIQTPSCPTRILSTTITKTTVKLKIGGLGAGKVTVTGRGIKKATKTIAKSTVATITAKRTGKSKPGAFKVKFTKAKAAVA